MKKILVSAFAVLAASLLSMKTGAQTEVMAWGNITGLRVDGELIDFESSFRVVDKGWTGLDFTGRERQQTQFRRDGASQIVTSSVQRVRFIETVTDKAKGLASVSFSLQSDTNRRVEGVYYAFALPDKHYVAGTVRIGGTRIALADLNGNSKVASGSRITITGSAGRRLGLDFSTGVKALVRKTAGQPALLYVQLMGGNLHKGQKAKMSFSIHAAGDVDHAPVEVDVDPQNPGRLFAGMGGDFRLQNPKADPQVIDYCLKNMRVAFGRVEMPWMLWQPKEEARPLAEALAGNLPEHVRLSMQMAQRLAAIGMPVIVSAWFPPRWALKPGQQMHRGGIAALRLDPAKRLAIYKSMADYLVALKRIYGVEAWAFSFNESDIGINVLFTPEEHARFIKGFGTYLASRGLATKLLLGDNSDATTFNFILPALNDPATHPYIAAVSFHSWRGCDDATLRKWAGAARQLNLPLVVAEGSTDAAAWRYPQIFLEPTFALYEINLYLRIAAICQPLSILQWQYTSDYSLLWGAGIYGSSGPLRTTQRFWNLKQLASTPANSFALPFTSSKEEVNCAVFGNVARGTYAVHMVNNGAARKAKIKGLPAGLTSVQAYATTDKMDMQPLPCTQDSDGSLSVDLPATGFVSIIARK
ncbi:MAG: hypothetical protein LBL81_01620 [Tannerella sp.]|jgi:hypothetical protein|nr:hypothetical protein [Tannerella sp.]